MDFVGNLLLFAALKKFCQSIITDKVIAIVRFDFDVVNMEDDSYFLKTGFQPSTGT